MWQGWLLLCFRLSSSLRFGTSYETILVKAVINYFYESLSAINLENVTASPARCAGRCIRFSNFHKIRFSAWDWVVCHSPNLRSCSRAREREMHLGRPCIVKNNPLHLAISRLFTKCLLYPAGYSMDRVSSSFPEGVPPLTYTSTLGS